ncbi:MAG: META domain-containing protein [Candidatus Krumholzibacteriota bacterium]
MRTFVMLMMILMLIGAAGCGKKEEATDQTAAADQPPTLEQTKVKVPPPAADKPADPFLTKLKNATYTGVQEQDPVTLTDGLWEGEPSAEGGASRPRVQFVRDYHLVGDLDGDGQDEAAVVLTAGSGGTVENSYLAVLGLREGELRNLDTVLLGDRVQIRKSGILEGRIFMDILRAGPEDALSNPGNLEGAAWRLENDKLVAMEAASAPLRLSLDSVAGPEWVLRWWTLDEEAPAEPEVTLSFLDGRLGGSSGCNTYSAAANTGEQPGDLQMGPAAGTRKMCPEEIMAVEQRYLAQMAGVKKFGYVAGMLALSFEHENGGGVMLFEGRKPAQ